jgi:membrane-bound lytic murein transglycosylase D
MRQALRRAIRTFGIIGIPGDPTSLTPAGECRESQVQTRGEPVQRLRGNVATPSSSFSLLLTSCLVLSVACAGSTPRRAARTSPDLGPSSRKGASHPPESPSPAEQAQAREETIPAPDVEDPVEAIIARAQEEYDRGLEALKSADAEKARDFFDNAIQIFMNSSIPMDQDKRLRGAFEKMVEDITSLESDLNETPPPSPDVEPSPAEKLRDITTYLTPEEARKEREKVGPEASQISFDIPMVINDQVLAWVEIFRTRKGFRESFIGGYQRYGWYEPMIHQIFKEEGLPADLIYMAYLESTYKPNAYSRARAKGIWQFMTPTGREYGLRVTRYVDERSHPEKATRAAARYVKDLYETLGDWHLAIAAYNTGAGNILRAQRRSGKSDYWELSKSRYMLRETKNFVPAILALALMAKDPAKYGFEGLVHNPPLTYDRVTVDRPTKLSLVARLTDSSEEELKLLNPHLRLGVTPPGEKSYEVMVPAGKRETFLAAYEAIPESEKMAKLTAVHTVRRGETLATIAARYGTSVDDLREANNIRNPHRISVGTQLTVPGAKGAALIDQDEPSGRRRSARRPSMTVSRDASYHVVRRGETLSSISRAYGIPLRTLMSLNGMTERSVIMPGARLALRREATVRASSVEPSITLPADAPPQLTAGFVSVPGGGLAPPDPAGAKILYRVRSGDNLFRIARKYGTSVENLKAWNGIPGDGIKAGDVLTVYPN